MYTLMIAAAFVAMLTVQLLPTLFGPFSPLLTPGVTMALGSAGAVITPEEFKTGIEDIRKSIKAESDLQKKGITDLDTALKEVRDENEKLKGEVGTLRKKALLTRHNGIIVPRKAGCVSHECAKYLGAIHIIAAKSRGCTVHDGVLKWSIEHIERDTACLEGEPEGEKLRVYAKAAASWETKAALTTSDIPLPTIYTGEIFELVEMFGSFRKYATLFPMGAGTVKVPRLSTDPAFGFIDISGAVPEKSPQIAFVELEAKKAGGIVRIPTEIDEDSIVALGQFLARYIARQVASWEDATGWNADGSATYKTLEGVKVRVSDNAKLVTLGAGLTGTDDVTLANLRTLRGVPNAAVYEEDAAYYMHPTMEAALSGFNVSGSFPWNPERETLDGWPVRWVNKFSPFSTAAVVSTVVVVFGAMRYWILGERGRLRIDYSKDVYFATDETGVRALWRFTVKEADTTHMAGIKTAAS